MKNLHFSRKRSIIILVLYYAKGVKRPEAALAVAAVQ